MRLPVFVGDRSAVMICYFGVSLNTNNLSGDRFKNGAFVALVEEPDAIGENDPNGLKIYPNPTSQNAMIEFDLDGEKLQGIQVVDMMGRTVDHLNISESRNSGLNRFKWNAEGFENGQYIIKVETDKRIRTKLIALQR